MAQAPKCRFCGERHWSPVCSKLNPDGLAGPASTADAQRANTKPAPKPRRLAPSVVRPADDISFGTIEFANQAELDAYNAAGAAHAAEEAKKRRGRPATGFDKKAYDREKARERRAAKRVKPDAGA